MRRYRLLAVVLVLALLLGCGEDRERTVSSAVEPRAGWTAYHDERRGYMATFPSGWHRARENLTPNLLAPREILSLGTYPLRYDRSARCQAPMCPVPALDGLGPTDVLLSVQESGAGSTGPTRKRPMRLSRVDLRSPKGVVQCWHGRVRWMAFQGFRDAGRNFYVFVAVGTRVSPRTRRELQRVLDSLRLEPR